MATLYVASEQQLRALLPDADLDSPHRTLFDVGSGTGTETEKVASVLIESSIVFLGSAPGGGLAKHRPAASLTECWIDCSIDDGVSDGVFDGIFDGMFDRGQVAASLNTDPQHVTCLESSGPMRSALEVGLYRSMPIGPSIEPSIEPSALDRTGVRINGQRELQRSCPFPAPRSGVGFPDCAVPWTIDLSVCARTLRSNLPELFDRTFQNSSIEPARTLRSNLPEPFDRTFQNTSVEPSRTLRSNLPEPFDRTFRNLLSTRVFQHSRCHN